jgi:hypothetical protein
LVLQNDHIIFEPTVNDFEELLTNFLDTIVLAVMKTPRVETKLYNEYKSVKSYLQPVIPTKIVEMAKERIRKVLKEESSGPRKYVQNFDKYMSLITGEAEAEVDDIVALNEGQNLDFQTILEAVNKLKDLNDDIQYNMEKVSRVGMFDIKSDELAHALSKRAEGLIARLMQRAN